MRKISNMTAVQPPGRYGALHLDNNVEQLQEKPDGDNAWINGGFFVLQQEVLDLIDNDLTSWEQKYYQIVVYGSRVLTGIMVSGSRWSIARSNAWSCGKWLAPWRLWYEPIVLAKSKVLVTGHTGFKGSWLVLWLLSLGADVWGLLSLRR